MSHTIFSVRLEEVLLEERSNRCQQVNHHLSVGNGCFWKQAVLATAFDRLRNKVLALSPTFSCAEPLTGTLRHSPLHRSSFLNKYMEGKNTKLHSWELIMHDIRMQIIYLTSKVFSHFGELNSAPETGTGAGSWKSSCGAGVQSPVLWVGNMKIWQWQFRINVWDAIYATHELHLKKM